MTNHSRSLSYAKSILCLGVVLFGATACDRFTKSDQHRYPSKPQHDAHGVGGDDYVQPADVTDICTAGPKTRSGNPSSYKVLGKWYRVMPSACGYSEEGLASWYGPGFHGKRTSSGERYDMNAISAAHKTLPIPVRVRVTNLENGQSLVIRVNDRGPFHKGRIIDLSKAAARQLGVLSKGTARVRVTVVDHPSNAAPTSPKPAQQFADGVSVSDMTETFALGEQDAPVQVSNRLPVADPYAPQPSPQHDSIYIQVGSFANQANALLLKRKLESDGIQHVRLFPVEVNGVWLNRVRVGGLSNTAEADRVSAHLKTLGYSSQQIIIKD